MRLRILAVSLLVAVAYGCASTPPPPGRIEVLQGIASWYGEEFAGRTTANGEIFDPSLLTAAHRTLPFGTLLDVTNPKTRESVRVRINDRGPYIGNRVIDLSYAAAQKISLIQPGSGVVDLAVIKMGRGEREPPTPFEVTAADIPTASSSAKPPAPKPQPAPAPTPDVPVVTAEKDFRVDVVEERAGTAVVTRKQVSADGKTIETVTIPADGVPVPAPAVVTPPTRTPAEALDSRRVLPPVVPRRVRGFFVQAGAFSQEANARALQQRLERIGQNSQVDSGELYRVRIGPFTTREQAVSARSTLEANGMSAIIVQE
jgi:rare lipoprotein A